MREQRQQRHSAKGGRCKANKVNTNAYVNIRILQETHQDVTAATAGVMLLRRQSDSATRADG
jgi:hypothetical protein